MESLRMRSRLLSLSRNVFSCWDEQLRDISENYTAALVKLHDLVKSDGISYGQLSLWYILMRRIKLYFKEYDERLTTMSKT